MSYMYTYISYLVLVLLCMACSRPLSRRMLMSDVDPAHPLCQICKAAKEYGILKCLERIFFLFSTLIFTYHPNITFGIWIYVY